MSPRGLVLWAGVAAWIASGCEDHTGAIGPGIDAAPSSNDAAGNDAPTSEAPDSPVFRAQAIGKPCELGVDAGVAKTEINPMAAGCESQICVQPALAPDISDRVSTGPLCSAECSTDDDCKNAEARSGGGDDPRCAGRFTCQIATSIGRLCCKRLCLCRDFFGSAGSDPAAAAACDPNNPINRCPNLPGR